MEAQTGVNYIDGLKKLFESMSGEEGKKWARPDAPILNNLADERTEPHIYYHNANYRISRKYINIEKYTLLKEKALLCIRSAGEARYHKCGEIQKRFQAIARVCSNVDRGPLARKRDVGNIYTQHRLRELQKEAAELEVPYTLPLPLGEDGLPRHNAPKSA